MPEDNTLFIAPAAYARLLEGQATLRTTVDPRVQAAQLLGVASVLVAPLRDASALAVVAQAACAVQARRLTGISTGSEDFDTVVRGRGRFGSKVIEAKGVQVLRAGSAPA